MPQIKCPNGHRLQVSDRHLGQTITCPSCQTSFVAAAEEGVTAPPAASPFDVSDGDAERRPLISTGKTFAGGFTIPTIINCFVGRPLLFFGLILVVLGRGCDATSMRSVNRANAQYTQIRTSFDLEWEAKSSKARQEVDKKTRAVNDLFKGGGPKFGDPDFQKREADLRKEQQVAQDELNKISQDRNAKRLEMEAGEWKSYRESSMKAASGHQMSVYWYEWIFIFGSIVLVLGILTLAFTGQGPEKWVAYIMIAILTFSLYVGGAAWLESTVSSFGGGPTTRPLPEPFFDK
jgi:hypothetical protein